MKNLQSPEFPRISFVFLLSIFLISIVTGSVWVFGRDEDNTPLDQHTHDSELIGPVTVQEVFADPKKYDGKRLFLRGYYYEAHEKVVLTSSVVADKETGYRGVSSEQIWASWDGYPRQELRARLNELPGIAEPDYFGQVEVEGIFEIANKRAGENENELGAGHLGQYKYSFLIEKISVYDETRKQYIPIPKPKRRRQ